MRTRVFCLTSLLLLFAAMAHADDWNKSYDVSGTPELRLITSDANVRVTAGTGTRSKPGSTHRITRSARAESVSTSTKPAMRSPSRSTIRITTGILAGAITIESSWR